MAAEQRVSQVWRRYLWIARDRFLGSTEHRHVIDHTYTGPYL